MKFIDNISKNEYEKFLKANDYSNFLQSYEWGEFCQIAKNKKPFYVGLIDDNNKLVCATLMIKTNLLMGFSYMYAPRGFILDYNNKELIKVFTDELKKYMKKNKIIYITVDPALSYQEIDNEAKKIENGMNNYEIFDEFVNNGYKHKGFNLLYESNQPRFSFIIPFSNYRDFDEVYKNFNKSMRKNIDKAKNFGIEVKKGTKDDIKIFYELITKTGNRDDFHPYSEKYYEKFYEIFNKENKCEIFVSYVYPKKVIAELNRLKEINKDKQNSLDKIEKMLEKYKNIKEEKIPVNAHIIVLDNNHATALYAGNDAEYKDVYANYLTYYEKMKHAFEKGAKDFDLFGVCGDPNTKFKNLAGIFEFKKQFGGKCIEYFGDFDLISNKLLYKVLPVLIKIYHKIRG